MLINGYELYQMVKLRQEEIERNARNAWKFEDIKKESFLQKVVKKWNNRQKSIMVQQNCGCVSQC